MVRRLEEVLSEVVHRLVVVCLFPAGSDIVPSLDYTGRWVTEVV